jgi:hypothetical protein
MTSENLSRTIEGMLMETLFPLFVVRQDGLIVSMTLPPRSTATGRIAMIFGEREDAEFAARKVGSRGRHAAVESIVALHGLRTVLAERTRVGDSHVLLEATTSHEGVVGHPVSIGRLATALTRFVQVAGGTSDVDSN